MKITVYTIKDCTFSKQEKEYLNTNKLIFEEKDLETNKDFLTEMLAISNNFAGTPVTRVEKDDGTISVLKGFTKEEFDTTFGFAPAVAEPSSPPTDQTVNPPVNDTPIQPVTDQTAPQAVDVPPVVDTPAEVASPVPPAPIETPVEAPTIDQDLSKEVAGPLQSVMDSLKSKSQAPEPTISEPPTMSPPVVEEPTVPPVVIDPAAPSIPDFPAK